MKINDIQPFLMEGIKFGQKEISDILSRSDDFNVGIEYEFRPNDDQKDNLEDWFKEYNIGNISETATEHDNMLEVITEKMDVGTAIKHLSNMFKLISDKEIEVPSMAGLHISISTNKYSLSDINLSKFLVLMNAEYLHGLFPERRHTKSIADKLLKNVNVEFDKFTKEVVGDIEEQIYRSLGEKEQTIKISDYSKVDMSGRIELRFFGGENYHKQLDTIKNELFRALFLLEIAYTDLHQKQYYRELYDLLLSNEQQLINKVLNNPVIIRVIDNPSEKVQLAAVNQNGNVIGYIIEKGIIPSEKVQLAAVNQNGWAIEFIKNPSEKVQLAAVNKSSFAIKYIDNPSEKVQLAAIKQNGWAIEFIKNPSEDVQIAAVNQNGGAIKYIDNPTEEVQLAAVTKNGFAIQFIDKPSKEVQLAAVKQNGHIIQYIVNPSEDVQLAAVKQNGRAIRFIDNPSEKVKALHKELWKS